MSNKSEMTIGLNIVAEIGQFQNQMKVVQSELSKLGASNSLKESFEGAYKQIQEEIKKIQNLTQGEKISVADEKAVAKSFDTIKRLWKSTVSQMDSEKMKGTLLKEDQQAIDAILSKLKTYNSDVRKINNARLSGLQTLKQEKDTAKSNLEIAKQELKQLNDTKKSLNDQLKSAQDKVSAAKASREAADAEVKAAKTLAETTKEQFKEQYTKDHNDSSRGWNLEWGKIVRAAGAQEDFTEKTKRAAEALEQEKTAQKEVDDIQSKIDTNSTKIEDSTKNVKNLSQAHEDAKKALDAYKDATANLKTDRFEELKRTLFDIEKTKINWADFGVKPEDIKNTADLQKVMQDIADKGGPRAKETLDNLKVAIDNSNRASGEASSKFDSVRQSLSNMTSVQSDVDRLTGRLIRFFSMDNAVRLFRRAIKSAVNTVKELDKVMTQTAVVTQYTVADMWKQLPEYTKRANELGLVVKDVYEASTLYYQQGLKTNEVVSLTNATLRMARIAGLEAADATDRMTNALRGFNMELTEANADNVADVYSKLAAMSASNVDEISTAMTKVASLAHSANMEFENTAAFLAQIIETTRESAETAGTALKTVVARFSEVKNLYSKGELLGTDEAGEEIDVNKVSKALRTAGINLNEFLVGQKGLDDIFMELASKWDSLDIVQQRYIATMAAGSRQQSRFIALMSDYKRTVELTTAANDASGASLEQYNKTLESIETKTNRLKNAWNEFLMGIANDQAIRSVLDALTGILQLINSITSAISGGGGLLKAVINIGLVVGGLKLGKNILMSILGDPSRQVTGWFGKISVAMKAQNAEMVGAGTKAGLGFNTGFEKATKGGLKGLLSRTFGKTVTAGQLGLQTIDFRDAKVFDQLKVDPAKLEAGFKQAFANIDTSKLTQEQQHAFDDITKAVNNGGKEFVTYDQQLKQVGVDMKLTGKQSDELGLKFDNSAQATNTMRAAMLGIGITMTLLGNGLEKLIGKSTWWTKSIKNVGMAMLGLGAIFPILNTAIDSFAKKATASISSIPIIGWIAVAISVLTTFVTVLVESSKKMEYAVQAASEAVETAKEQLQQAKDAVEDLNSSWDAIQEQEKTIEELKQGTKEWTEAVDKQNESVLELLSKYKELQVVNKGGILTITNYDDVINQQKILSTLSSLDLISSQMELSKTNRDKLIADQSDYLLYQSGPDKKIAATATKLESRFFKEVAEEALKKDIVVGDTQEFRELIVEKGMGVGYNSEQLAGAASYLNTDNVNEIASIVNNINQFSKEIKNAATAMGPYISSISSAEVANSKYAEVFLNDSQRIASQIQNIADSFQSTKYKSENGEYKKDITDARLGYEAYVKEKYGNVAITGNKGTFTANGTTHNWESEQQGYAAWLAAQKLADKMAAYTKELERLEKSNSDQDKAMAKAFEKMEGGALTKETLDSLVSDFSWQGFDWDRTKSEILQDENGPLQQFRDLWNNTKDGTGVKAMFDDLDSYLNAIYDKIIPTADIFYHKMQGELGKAINNLNLTSDISKALYNQFSNAFANWDPELYGDLLNFDKLEIKSDQLEKFLGELSTLDFRNQKDLNEFSAHLKDLGITFNENNLTEYLDEIAKATNALVQVDIKKFTEQAKDLSKVISDIRGGKQTRVFSEDIYEKLIENSPDLVNQFTYREDGSYLFIGDKLDNIVNAINQQTNDLLGKGREQVEAKKAAWDIAAGITELSIGTRIGRKQDENGNWVDWYAIQEDVDRNYIQQVIDAYKAQGKDIGNLGIDGLISNNVDLNKVGAKTLASWKQAFTEDIVANYHTWKEQQESLDKNMVQANAMAYTPEQLAQNYGYVVVDQNTNERRAATEEEQSAQQKALLSKLSMVAPEEILNQYLNTDEWSATAPEEISRIYNAYAEAAELGLDTSLMQEWTAELQRTKNLSLDVASEIALANTKLNTGVKKIIDSYEDWEDLIGKNGPLGKGAKFEFKSNEENEQYQALKKNLELALDLNGSLSDSFFESEKNIEAIDALTNGTFEEKEAALEYLRKAAAINVTENIEDAEFDIDNLVNYIDTLDIPDIEVGATVKDEKLQAGLSKIVAEAGDAADDIINALGFTTDYKQIGTKKVFTGWKTVTTHAGYGIDEMENIPQYKEIPIYQFVAKGNGEGGSGNSGLSPSNGSTTGKRDSTSKDSKKKDWKNPYDELYNLQEHINSALREREKLEADYQRMLENHRKTGADLQKQSMLEIASLKKQLYYQEQMMAGRKKQMANVLNETYEDSEGNRKTYGSMGLQKYAWYEEDTQTVHIEWDKINQVTDEDQGKAIEAYVSRLEELRDKMQDVEDAIDEANDQIREIQMRNTEEYLEFEQRVYDALVNSYQRQIDELSNINDSINEATTKTLDAISDEIEKERQARERDKEREELSDKEARLAYLQRDTSGMNALEIQKMQEEIENARQDYQDHIVDDTLQEMRDEAARAEEQRSAQIELMQDQLQYWQDAGLLWGRVETLINTGVNNSGKIISGSDLDELLKTNENVSAMSTIAALDWTEQLAETVAHQFEGLANWRVEQARNEGKVTIDGKTYKYDPENNKWTDEKGNEYNISWKKDNSTAGGHYTASQVQKPKEVPVGSGAQQPGGGGTGGTGGTVEDPDAERRKREEEERRKREEEERLKRERAKRLAEVKQEDKQIIAALLATDYLDYNYIKEQMGENRAKEINNMAAGRSYNEYLFNLANQSSSWTRDQRFAEYAKNGLFWQRPYWTKYAQGGLADFTGPAWLDGTKSHPEMVLNATDTQNLITLKNILGAILQNANSASKTSTGDNYFDINIDAQISSDYDVDQLSERIKKQIYDDASYRNVNTLHYIR